MKAIVAIYLAVFTTAVTSVDAGERTSTVEAPVQGAASDSTDGRSLLYDGQPFEHWRNVLATELKGERQTEALRAIGCFAANGRSRDAVAAISEFMHKPSRLPADAVAQEKLVSAAVMVIGRADEADVMAAVSAPEKFATDATTEFRRKAIAHFAYYSKSYPVEELIPAVNDGREHHTDLSRFVAELEAQFPPQTWQEDGGKCDMAALETNLSVVVSAPAPVHQAMQKVLDEMRQTRPLTRKYDVAHFLGTKSSIARTKEDLDSLAELISVSIRPTSWEAVGGAGTLRQDHATRMLVVGQQPIEVHQEIADLLEQLSSLAKN